MVSVIAGGGAVGIHVFHSFQCMKDLSQSYIGNDTALLGFRGQAFGDIIRTVL